MRGVARAAAAGAAARITTTSKAMRSFCGTNTNLLQ